MMILIALVDRRHVGRKTTNRCTNSHHGIVHICTYLHRVYTTITRIRDPCANSSVEYEDGKLLALSLTPRGLSGTMLNLVPGWTNYPVKLDEVLDIWLATGELAPVPSATISIALTRNDTLCQVSFSIDSITLIAKYLYETEGSIDDKKIVETYINDPLAGFRYYPRLVVTVTEDYLECRKVEENQGS